MIRIHTAESVTEGHPDKLADLIADSILDECLAIDPDSRVACEVMLAHNKVFLSGEITTEANLNYERIAMNAINSVGYDTKNLEFESRIHEQSADIAGAVDKLNQGAGDQGIVYGYACDETPELMPLPISLAHRLTDRLTECRKEGIIAGLMPDGKSQVSIAYDDETGKVVRVLSIIVSAQHKEDKDIKILQREIRENVINYVMKDYILKKTEILINPSGRFVIGGFEADTGLTGRKLMVDTYGGRAHHGGGAMSGKDASKVDRSGAYLARYIAKNIVAAKLAAECEVAISYAIGVPEPTTIDINTFGTGAVEDDLLREAVKRTFDLSVAGNIEALDLRQPVYRETATGGHFGKNYFMWELTNKVEELLETCGA